MTIYTLFGQTPAPALASDNSAYTLGPQFTVSENVSLTGIWFYSASGAGALPTQCGVYQVTGAGTGTLVASDLSVTWSGALGSGWVKCSFDGSVTLTPGNSYQVVVYSAFTGPWYAATGHYWDTGAGSGGITSGPLTAPSNAAVNTKWGAGGQDMFITPSAGLTMPTTAFNATNYWVDVEVTTANAGQNTPSILVREMSQALVMTLQSGEQEWDEWVE